MRQEVDQIKNNYFEMLEQKTKESERREEENIRRISEQYQTYIDKYHSLYQQMLKEFRQSSDYEKI